MHITGGFTYELPFSLSFRDRLRIVKQEKEAKPILHVKVQRKTIPHIDHIFISFSKPFSFSRSFLPPLSVICKF